VAKRKHWRDPFADYIEWTNHRLNPGHYLGGNIPPDLHKSYLGPKGRRFAGFALILSAFMSAVTFAALMAVESIDLWMSVVTLLGALIVALTLVAGIEMLRAAGRRR
jgi:hypothetical protein